MTMIETKDLTFAYPAEEGKRSEPALRGVSLGIEKGSFVVVLGLDIYTGFTDLMGE